jgi:hypothetical protein
MIWNVDGRVYSGTSIAVRYDNGYEVAYRAPLELLQQLQGARILEINGLKKGPILIKNYDGFLEASSKARGYCLAASRR